MGVEKQSYLGFHPPPWLSPRRFPRHKLWGGGLFLGQKGTSFEKTSTPPHFTLHKTSLRSKMVVDTRVVVIVGTRTGQGRRSGVS